MCAQCINKIYYFHVSQRETTALQLDFSNKRKRHTNENKVAKEGLNLSEEDKRQKVHILQTISNYELNLTLTHRK